MQRDVGRTLDGERLPVHAWSVQPSRMPQLTLPFAVIGAVAGWLGTGLLCNPLLQVSSERTRPVATLCAAAVAAAVGAYVTERCRREGDAWTITGATWARVVCAVLVGGAAAGACVGGVIVGPEITIRRSISSGLMIGALCAVAFLPVCAVVVAAARRAARARMGSLVARADRRAVWSILAAAASVATLAALPDWPAASAFDVEVPWAAIAIVIACAAVIAVGLVADAFALRKLLRIARRALDVEPAQALEEAARGGADVLDVGLGAEASVAFEHRGSAYRAHARAVAVVIGDLTAATTALRRAIVRGIASLALLAAVLTAHRWAARPEMVVTFHAQRCERSQGSCRVAALLLLPGGSSTIPPDPRRAARLHDRACDAGHVSSCVDLAAMLERGEHIDRDPARAFELRQRACLPGDGDSCRVAAHALLMAEPPRPVIGEVTRLLERGCQAGHRPSCHDLPLVRDAAPDSILPRAIVQCLAGSAHACVQAGGSYDDPRSALVWERACMHGNGWHCSEAAFRYRQPRWHCVGSEPCRYVDDHTNTTGLARAGKLYEHGCQLGFGTACCDGAYLRIFGDPERRSREQAVKLAERGATLGYGHAGGCEILRREGVLGN
jgi:TPR repeat protein